jgi:hypothetical protein
MTDQTAGRIVKVCSLVLVVLMVELPAMFEAHKILMGLAILALLPLLKWLPSAPRRRGPGRVRPAAGGGGHVEQEPGGCPPGHAARSVAPGRPTRSEPGAGQAGTSPSAGPGPEAGTGGLRPPAYRR